jgi:hypothetical protein
VRRAMRRLVLVALWVAVLPSCKGMGGFASGLGHAASGLGHVASAVGHVAAPVASGFARVAAPIATGVARAAPVVGKTALYATEAALEAGALTPTVVVDPVESLPDPPDETADLCLDCPDAGNCASCPESR